MTATHTIGRLALATGCKVQTVRYYEQIGLLPEPIRSQGNQRLYGQTDIDRLAFIRHSRELGFSLQAIRDLLSLSDDPEKPCEAVDAIAQVQLEEVERRIVSLRALKLELTRMLQQCRGGRVSECRIIAVLSDHSLCQTVEHEPVV